MSKSLKTLAEAGLVGLVLTVMSGCTISDGSDAVENMFVAANENEIRSQLELSEVSSWSMVSNVIAVSRDQSLTFLGKPDPGRTVWNRIICNMPGFDNAERNSLGKAPVSLPILFGGRQVVVTPRDRNIVLCENDEQGHVLGVCKHGGHAWVLQSAGVAKCKEMEYLVVIKSIATYRNESRIHIFDSDFKCVAEGEIPGRDWRMLIMPTGELYIARVGAACQVKDFRRLVNANASSRSCRH